LNVQFQTIFSFPLLCPHSTGQFLPFHNFVRAVPDIFFLY
jgi:hypothetical protein